MNMWFLVLGLVLFVLYILVSLGFVPFVNFRYHDYYKNEDVIYGPERPDWVDKDALLVDLHTHTTASDGVLTPKQLVHWHISNGYDGMVVSDHNTMLSVNKCKKAAREIDPDFLVIPGVEFTSMRIHLNLIGVKSLMKVPNLLWTRKKTVIKAIKHAHEEGGVVQFNHPDWYPHKRYLSKKWYLKHDIDGFEVYNGFGFIDEQALDFIKDNKDKKIMYPSAGTDIHDPATHLRCYTEILTEDKTVEGVIKALKQGNARAHCDVDAERNRKRPEKGKLKKNEKKLRINKNFRWLNWLGYDILYHGRWKPPLVFITLGLVTVIGISFLI